MVTGHPDTQIDDAAQPAIGLFYLIRADGCGAGTFGTDSTGAERINLDPGACP